VDIHSATAEIMRRKKKKEEERRRKKKPQDEFIMSASATQGGHKTDMIRRNCPVRSTLLFNRTLNCS